MSVYQINENVKTSDVPLNDYFIDLTLDNKVLKAFKINEYPPGPILPVTNPPLGRVPPLSPNNRHYNYIDNLGYNASNHNTYNPN